MKNTSLILCLTGFFTFFVSNVFSQDTYFFNSNKITTIPDTEVECWNSNNYRTCRFAEPSIKTIAINSPSIDILFNQYTFSIPSSQALAPFSKERIKVSGYPSIFTRTYTSVDFAWKKGRIDLTFCEGETINLDLSNELEKYSLSTTFSGEGVNSHYFQISKPGAYIVVASRMFFNGPASENVLINVTATEPIEITAGEPISNVCYYPEEKTVPSASTKIEISNKGESPTGGTWNLLETIILFRGEEIDVDIQDAIFRLQGDGDVSKDYLNPSKLEDIPNEVYTLRYTYQSNGCTYTADKDLEVNFFPPELYNNLKLEANKKEVYFSELFEVQVASIDPGFTLESGAFSRYSWNLDDDITLDNCEIPRRIYSKPGLKTIVFNGTVENGCVHTIKGEDFLNVAGVRPPERLSAQELELLQN